ncbi:hypothetical protein MKW98_025205 [Papaver atlanticum]|uniref:Uncharacterized protein n=1 Tax=Papaver atlanticum TaxID=357466 RepID=A0AAD4X686_9MAGN|nr:hypothetical protein MKW98_025205 [Papaver atlanticum]
MINRGKDLCRSFRFFFHTRTRDPKKFNGGYLRSFLQIFELYSYDVNFKGFEILVVAVTVDGTNAYLLSIVRRERSLRLFHDEEDDARSSKKDACPIAVNNATIVAKPVRSCIPAFWMPPSLQENPANGVHLPDTPMTGGQMGNQDPRPPNVTKFSYLHFTL